LHHEKLLGDVQFLQIFKLECLAILDSDVITLANAVEVVY
jgi:hypothetical protein